MSDFQLTPDWLNRKFETRVRRRVFHHSPQEHPVAVLLGGQPGAGKTRAGQFAQHLHQGVLNAITGDDYRSVHPDYKWLQAHDPVAMPRITQAVSGPMVERAIAYARENHFSVLVEGTFRNPEVSLSTARAFHEAGYEVHIIALAVPPAVSRMSAVARFYETLDHGENRWTPLTAHEDAVAHMPATVKALGESPVVDRLTLMDRSGNILFDSTTPSAHRGHDASEQVVIHHQRPLTDAEQDQIQHTYRSIEEVARTNPVAQNMAADPGVRAAWQLLARDQAALLDTSI